MENGINWKEMLFEVLTTQPEAIERLPISQNKAALIELLPHSPACYLFLERSMRADGDILIAALSNKKTKVEVSEDAQSLSQVSVIREALGLKIRRNSEGYSYLYNIQKWPKKVPVNLRRDFAFALKALEASKYVYDLVDPELTQRPQFLIKAAELYGVDILNRFADKAIYGPVYSDAAAEKLLSKLKIEQEAKNLLANAPLATPPNGTKSKSKFKI